MFNADCLALQGEKTIITTFGFSHLIKIFILFMKYLFFLFLVPFVCLGDTYPKNPNIDVKHYAFSIHLSDETDEINATAEITFLFKISGIERIRLDLINQSEQLQGKGMTVNRILALNIEMKYSHQDNVLWIDLPAPSTAGQFITLQISYHGIPASGLKIGPNKYEDRTFFSDNWPNRARNWLPTVDHPYEKATSEFIVIAPKQYQVVSNGLLLEESSQSDGMKLTHWKQSVPISCWLYVLGVAEFAVQYVDQFDGKSIQTWVYKQDRDAGFYDFAVPTKKTLSFFSDYIGPFVYEKLANIQSNSVGGGMEAASAILYGDNSVTGTRDTRWRNVVIHEVAHQWFGNSVTEYDWDDVWLSEGFATYFTLLFIEHAYGRDEFVDGLKKARNRVFAFYEKNKEYRIVHDNLDDMSKVTTGNTYQKGAWILHMLRQEMGDEAFRKGIQEYYHKFMNGTTSTTEFRQIMEIHHGKSLEGFFQQWLYQGGNIILEGTWIYNEKKQSLEVIIKQIQNDGFTFSSSVSLGVYEKGSDVPIIHTLKMEESTLKASFNLAIKPDKIVLDPDTQLLAQWKFSER